MNKIVHSWRRYWCLRDQSYALTDDGYLPDPAIDGTAFVNPNAQNFEMIATMPCLVLLGEPGIGKTFAVEDAQNSLKISLQGTSDTLLSINLRSVPSVDEFRRKFFLSPEFQAWLEGDHYLHVFLDSFDECMVRVTTLAALLADEIKLLPTERLRLRIACRTVEWPSLLEDALQNIWGAEGLGIFELLPLTRANVISAAVDYKIAPEGFLEAVRQAGATPLAIKPISLRFLFQRYQRANTLPNAQRPLYAEGCRLLCEEQNDSRLAARDTRPRLNADKRIAVAARIAAITLFTNRYSIWTAPDLGDVPEGVVPLRELSGDTESIHDTVFSVDEEALRETLDTGLFVSHGLNLMGWSHRTYAEFLAAEFTLNHKMPDQQVAGLITLDDGKVVPQLHEVAARIAMSRPSMLRRILRADPLVLLLSDASSLGDNDRAFTLAYLLDALDKSDISFHDIPEPERLRKLEHVGLEAQLRQVIQDKTKSEPCRYAAVETATACKMRELEDDLLAVALDTSEGADIRAKAARSISVIGTSIYKARLLPLVEGTSGADPDDDLKGSALHALWPDILTAEQLFSLLTSPKRHMHFGSY